MGMQPMFRSFKYMPPCIFFRGTSIRSSNVNDYEDNQTNEQHLALIIF